jgi:hypothetical protein
MTNYMTNNNQCTCNLPQAQGWCAIHSCAACNQTNQLALQQSVNNQASQQGLGYHTCNNQCTCRDANGTAQHCNIHGHLITSNEQYPLEKQYTINKDLFDRLDKLQTRVFELEEENWLNAPLTADEAAKFELEDVALVVGQKQAEKLAPSAGDRLPAPDTQAGTLSCAGGSLVGASVFDSEPSTGTTDGTLLPALVFDYMVLGLKETCGLDYTASPIHTDGNYEWCILDGVKYMRGK